MKYRSIIVMIIVTIFVIPSLSSAQAQVEFTPSLSLNESYDDNLYLDRSDKKYDYITTVSPGINLNILSQRGHLSLGYAPTFVKYNKEELNDTVRHSGNLALDQELTRHLSLDLSDTYIKSEDPIEETEGIEGVRDTRNPYWRNTFQVNLQSVIGTESVFSLGYKQVMLENEDITIDDGTTQTPFVTLTYWFNTKNGMELNSSYIEADFSSDDDTLSGDDYIGSDAGFRYLHRFTRHTMGFIGYDLAGRDFEGLSEDYIVHSGDVGLEHSFSPELSLALSGGYFFQEIDGTDGSDDTSGYSYDVNLTRLFERGSFSIGGQGGYREAYLEAERRGFTRFQGGNARFEYQLTEKLSNYANGSYTRNKDPNDQEWKTININYGFRWTPLTWLSASLDYSCNTRDYEIHERDYYRNRVMLTLTANKVFRY
jgi:hypothetical protein